MLTNPHTVATVSCH